MRMRPYLVVSLSVGAIALATALGRGSAYAQTTCYPNNPSIPAAGEHCYDVGPPQQASPSLRPAQVTAPPPPGSAQEMCLGAGVFGFGQCMAKVEAERRKVGAMMASGQCDAAYQEALRGGDFQTAVTVKQLCTAKP